MTGTTLRADVVVVGGGSAGCVVAARLSENPNRSVVLLEAGRHAPSEARVATELPIGPDSPWVRHYNVELASGARAVIPRGRVLGGSGVVNGGYFARALPVDFGGWQWSFEDALPYYRKLETEHDFCGAEHGDRGPIPVRRARDLTPFDDTFVDACLRAGYPLIDDFNAGDARGVGRVPCNIADGLRVDTASAYLVPGRANLRIFAGTAASRIVVDGQRARGVEAAGIRIEAETTVLCAGAIESPALLLRSGVGDPDVLRGLGVDLVHALPAVGREFVDHPEVTIAHDGIGRGTSVLNVVLNTGDVEIRPYARSFGTMLIGVALMHPLARGRLHWTSGVTPRIDYHYDIDRDRLRVAAAHAGAVLGIDASAPRLGTSQHMTGTCRMGRADDPGAVVDERCRVHGLDGLAVVDASIIPTSLSRGIHATVVMVAERAADLL